MGTTSPAYTILLAGISYVTSIRDIPAIALYLNAFCLAVVVFMAYLIAEELTAGRLSSFLVSVLVACSSINVYVSAMGFEGMLLTLAVLSSLYFARHGSMFAALLVASVAPLIRPEGILCAGIVWGRLIASRQLRVAHLLVFLVLPCAWIVFAGMYFGSPIPHSITAKRFFPYVYQPYDGHGATILEHVINTPYEFGTFLVDVAYPAIAGNQFKTSYEAPTVSILPTLAFAVAFLTLVWTFMKWRELGRGFVYYSLYPMMFAVFYAFVGKTCVWYLPSFYTLSIVVLTASSFRAVRHLLASNKFGMISKMRTGMVKWVICLFVFLCFVGANQYRFNDDAGSASIDTQRFPDIRGAAPVLACDPRGQFWEWMELIRFYVYRQAALFLNDYSQVTTKTLINEVGVFGYYYKGTVIDSVGLCSPESLQFYPPPASELYDEAGKTFTRSNNIIPSKLVLAVEPDYIVSMDIYIVYLLKGSEWFKKRYSMTDKVFYIFKRPLFILKRNS